MKLRLPLLLASLLLASFAVAPGYSGENDTFTSSLTDDVIKADLAPNIGNNGTLALDGTYTGTLTLEGNNKGNIASGGATGGYGGQVKLTGGTGFTGTLKVSKGLGIIFSMAQLPGKIIFDNATFYFGDSTAVMASDWDVQAGGVKINGSSGSSYTFSGKMTGTGDITTTLGGAGSHIFSGDVSEFSGKWNALTTNRTYQFGTNGQTAVAGGKVGGNFIGSNAIFRFAYNTAYEVAGNFTGVKEVNVNQAGAVATFSGSILNGTAAGISTFNSIAGSRSLFLGQSIIGNISGGGALEIGDATHAVNMTIKNAAAASTVSNWTIGAGSKLIIEADGALGSGSVTSAGGTLAFTGTGNRTVANNLNGLLNLSVSGSALNVTLQGAANALTGTTSITGKSTLTLDCTTAAVSVAGTGKLTLNDGTLNIKTGVGLAVQTFGGIQLDGGSNLIKVEGAGAGIFVFTAGVIGGTGALVIQGVESFTGTFDASFNSRLVRFFDGTKYYRANVDVGAGQVVKGTEIVIVELKASGNDPSDYCKLSDSLVMTNTSKETIVELSINVGDKDASLTLGSGGLDITGELIFTGAPGKTVTIENSALKTASVTMDGTGGKLLINSDLTTGSVKIATGMELALGGEAVFNGALQGAGTLRMTGDGKTLFLKAAGNFSGNISLDKGTLAFAKDSLGTGTLLMKDGTTLKWLEGNTQDISSRLTVANDATVTFDLGANGVTLGTALAATGTTYVKKGSGLLTTSAANLKGILKISEGGAEVTIADNGTLNYVLENNANLTWKGSAGENNLYTGTVAGTGNWTIAGTGASVNWTVVGSVNNDFSGTLTLANGSGYFFVKTPTSSPDGTNFFKNGASVDLVINSVSAPVAGTVYNTGLIIGMYYATQDKAFAVGNLSGTGGDIRGDVEITTISRWLSVTQTRDDVFAGMFLDNGVRSVGLVKKGAATLTLTNNNASTNSLVVKDGTLQLGNGGTSGSWAGAITVDASAFVTFNRSGAVSIANNMDGNGTVKFMGGATYTLTGTQRTVTEFLLTDGVLKIGAAGADGTGKVTLQGGVYELAAKGDFLRNINLAAATGTISVTAADGDAVLKGSITGTGNLDKTGAGTLLLDNGTTSTGQTFTGGVTVSSGTLQLGQPNGGTTGRSITYGSGEMTVKNGARLSLAFAESQTLFNTLTNKVVLENGSTLYLNNGNTALGGGLKAGASASDSVTLLYKYNHELTLNTALEGAGAINMSESGENAAFSLGGGGLILTRDSTAFSGKIVVGAPTSDTSVKRYGLFLRLDTTKAASGADIELKAGSEASGGRIAGTQLLVNADSVEIGGLTGDAGTRLLSGATKDTGDKAKIRELVLNGTGTFSGTIDTNLTLTKKGANTTQTLAGGVLLMNGTALTMKVDSGTLALGTGSDTLEAGLLASNYTVNAGGVLQVNSKMNDVRATGTVSLNGGNLNFGTSLDGNNFAQKVTFSGNNGSITGGSNNAGDQGWVLSRGASTEDTAAVIKVNSSITGSTISAGKIYFMNTTEAGAAIFDLAANSSLEMNSVLAGPAGSAAAFKIRGGGTLVYTGSDNGSGPAQMAVKAIVENGTLKIGNGGTTGSWGNGSDKKGAIQLGATGAVDGTGAVLEFNRSDALTYGGVISGKGTVNFEGGANSVYTLQGDNTFTGAVNINQGKVIADSTKSFGTGSTINLTTGRTLDFAQAQSDATSVLNAASSSIIERGANFNGKLNILANTTDTAVNVTGGLGISELNFADNSHLAVNGNVVGGKVVMDQNASLNIANGNLNLTSLEIKSHTSQVSVGGNVTITSGGQLYLNLATATNPLVTATGSINLSGTFLLGFNSNEMTTGEYDFTLFHGASYSGIQAQLEFANSGDRPFYYLDTSKFKTDGIVTVVKTDWGYNLVDTADIAGIVGGNYTPSNGKELLGAKAPVAVGDAGTRDNPVNFNIGYTPVANGEGVTAYRLTDGEGWMNFQTQMTGDSVGLVIQGYMGFTGDSADHGLIISNNSNNYAGGTSVLNAHVVLDSSLAANASDKLTEGTIGMLGSGDVTFIGSLSELELRPNGDADGEFTFANNLTLKDGAMLSQTGGTNTLTGSLTLVNPDGGIVKNASANELILEGAVTGSKLTLRGDGAAGTSIIKFTNAGVGNTVQELVLEDKISFALNGGKLVAAALALTSGNIDITNGGSLVMGGVTGSADSTITVNGGTLGTGETGSGVAIVLGGADKPAVILNGTGNSIVVGNEKGLEIRDLTGTGAFELKGGHLTLSGGTADSHFSGVATVGVNSLLTVGQNAYLGGSITTTALAAAAITVQIQGGSSADQRTIAGSLELNENNTASLDGDHITLGDITLKGKSALGSSLENSANDVTVSSLTIATEGIAAFGDDLHITGNASVANGALQAGERAMIGGDASVGNGSLLAASLSVDGKVTLGDGSVAAVDSLELGSLEITGKGVVQTDTTDPAHSIAINGDAVVGNGSILTGVLSIDGVATLGNGSVAAINSIHLGSLEITGSGSVLTDTTDMAHSIAIDGDALIGNGSVQTGTLSIGGNTVLNNGFLTVLGDNAHLAGGLTISGAEGKAEFKNNIAIDGLIDITKGSLTVGDDSSLGNMDIKGGKVSLGGQALVGSLHVSDGGSFTSGDGSGIATGEDESISIGSGSTVTFGKNTTLGSSGSAIDIATGSTVNFGAGTHIEGSLGDRGLTFAAGSSYSGFLNAGTNNVNFENGSSYLLNGPVLQQYTTDTVGLQSTGTISVDNGTRFILGENLGDYSILEAPETMTLIQASGDGKLLVGGEQVKEKSNYGYLLENADKYFEWLTFNLIGGNNSLELEMQRFVRFESVATTANEKAMAPIANILGTETAFYNGELKKLGSALALSAKGDGHTNLSRLALSNASLLSGYLAQTQEVRRHNYDILTRASQEKTGAERLSYEEYNNTVWANGTGGTYTMRGDSNAAGYRTNQWGGILGASHGFSEHFVGGVAFSYTHSDTTVDGNYGSATGDSYDIDLFGKYNRNNWNIIGAVTGGLTSLDTTRNLEIGSYSSRTTASGDGSHLLATLQAGYQFAVSDDLNSILEPFAIISGGYSSIDGLSERGAGNAGLVTESRDQSLCTVGAGVRFSREYFTNADEGMKGRFEIRAMILQDLTDVDGDVTAHYQGMNERFRLDGAASSRLGVLAGAGIVQPLTRQTSIFGDVDGEFRSGENGVRANIGVKYSF